MSRLRTHTRTDGRTECEDRARILETEFAIMACGRDVGIVLIINCCMEELIEENLLG